MKNIIDALNINIQIFFCIIHPTNKLVGFLMSFIVNNQHEDISSVIIEMPETKVGA